MSTTSAAVATLGLETTARLRVLPDEDCAPGDCIEHPDNRGPIVDAVEYLNQITAAIVRGDPCQTETRPQSH